MQCKEIEAVLENEGLSPLPEAVRAHAASCGACSNLIADFSAIISVAETLPAEVEPPTRVWVALRNQLEAEGIIRAGAAVRVAEPASWIENLSSLLRGRRVGLIPAFGSWNADPQSALADGGRTMSGGHTGARVLGALIVAETALTAPPITSTEPLGASGQILHQEEQNLPMVQPADFSNQDRAEARVDLSLRQNLKSLNQFIEECRRRLKEDPNDELAREYLSVAYQQKAELLSAMLDRGRSVN